MTVSLNLDQTPDHLAPLTVAQDEQHGPVIHVLVVNNMPNKAATEEDACRFFGSLPGNYRLTFVLPSERWPDNLTERHALEMGYAERKADGMLALRPVSQDLVRANDIILQTGAPIETRKSNSEIKPSFDANCRIMDWARIEDKINIQWCWSGMVGLQHQHGIEPRIPLQGGSFKPLSEMTHKDCPKKIYGNTRLRLSDDTAPFVGADEITLPISRAAYYGNEQFEGSPLTLVASDDKTGPAILSDIANKTIICLNHPEYASSTLLFEYVRDASQTLKKDRLANPGTTDSFPHPMAKNYPLDVPRKELVIHAVHMQHALEQRGLSHDAPDNYPLLDGIQQARIQKNYVRQGAAVFAHLFAQMGLIEYHPPQPVGQRFNSTAEWLAHNRAAAG
jgi:homoserine O-succinyltransferase